MKNLHKNVLGVALGASLSMFLALPAGAQQHRDAPGSSTSSSSGNSSAPRQSAPTPQPQQSYSPRPSAPQPQPQQSYSPRPQQQPGSINSYTRPSNGYQPQQQPQRIGIAPNGSVQQNIGYGQQRGSVQQQPGRYTPAGINPPQKSNFYAPRPGYTPGQGYTVGQRNNAFGNNTGTAARPYVGGQRLNNNSGYRAYPGTGFERGRESWKQHGYYHYNRGYYGSYYRPRLGFSIGILPVGYYPFTYDDYNYYYSDGLYYQYTNNEYTVVEPPVGAEITTLPEKAQSIMINGQQFYELNGVYYQAVTKDDGTVVYVIAGKDGELNTDSFSDDTDQGPHIGDIVNDLPQDCRKIKVNGQKLYVSPDGIYYQELVDDKGNKTYKIVGLPSDEGDQN